MHKALDHVFKLQHCWVKLKDCKTKAAAYWFRRSNFIYTQKFAPILSWIWSLSHNFLHYEEKGMPKLYKSFSEKSTSTIPKKKNVWDWNNSIMGLGLTCHTSGWSLKISESDVFVFFFGDVVRVKEKWKLCHNGNLILRHGAAENASEITKIIGEYRDVWYGCFRK